MARIRVMELQQDRRERLGTVDCVRSGRFGHSHNLSIKPSTRSPVVTFVQNKKRGLYSVITT